jgi:predicted ester cyclase
MMDTNVDLDSVCPSGVEKKLEGWMEKEGHVFKTWNKRWFELDSTRFVLFYYENSDKKAKKGEYGIIETTVVVEVSGSKKPNAFRLETAGSSDVLILSASSVVEMKKWMTAIQSLSATRRAYSAESTVSALRISGSWKEGWLEKEGGSHKSWKKRWICLECQDGAFVLTYFEDQKKKSKKGEYALSRKSSVSSLDDGFHDVKRNLFSVVDMDSEHRAMFVMSAASPCLKAEWIETIQRAISAHKQLQPGSGMVSVDVPIAEIVRPLYSDCLTRSGDGNSEVAVSTVKALLSPSFEYIGAQVESKMQFVELVLHYWQSVPDLRWEAEEVLVDGGRVVVRGSVSGRPVGSFLGVEGLDGSRRFSMSSVHIHSLESGKIVCTHHVEDWATARAHLTGTSIAS